MKKLLHVGCGKSPLLDRYKKYKETRLDIDESTGPDIINDIRNMVDVKDSSFDLVYSCHNIEHLQMSGVYKALNEFKRVLVNGGLLHIDCPNLKEAAKYVATDKLDFPLYQSDYGPITPFDVIFGHRGLSIDNEFMLHKSGFTARSLTYILENSGFKNVHVQEKPLNLFASCEVQK